MASFNTSFRLSDADANIQILADFQLGRWLTMFAGYIDDSGRGQRPSFIFAGFVTRAEDWIRFNRAWCAVLDKEPRLSYFKTKEAMRRSGQFEGWSRESIDERIDQLMGVIENTNYNLARIGISISYKHFEDIFAGQIGPATDTPYVYAAQMIMVHALNGLFEHGCRERVQFIFDTASMREQIQILRGWHFAFTKDPPAYDPFRPLIGDPPSFRDDKQLPPLQAADLYAWHLRRAQNLSRKTGGEWVHPIWARLSALPLVVEHDYGAMELTNSVKNVRKMADKMKIRLYYAPKVKQK